MQYNRVYLRCIMIRKVSVSRPQKHYHSTGCQSVQDPNTQQFSRLIFAQSPNLESFLAQIKISVKIHVHPWFKFYRLFQQLKSIIADRKVLIWIRPAAVFMKTSFLSHLPEAVHRIFMRIFGADRLLFFKMER